MDFESSYTIQCIHNSMYYLYDDLRVMYPQLLTAAHKAKPEQEDRLGEGVWMRSAQSEGKDEIMSLKSKLWVVIQRSTQQTTYGKPGPLGNGGNVNRNQNNRRGNGSGQNHCEKCDHSGMKSFHCEGWEHVTQKFQALL